MTEKNYPHSLLTPGPEVVAKINAESVKIISDDTEEMITLLEGYNGLFKSSLDDTVTAYLAAVEGYLFSGMNSMPDLVKSIRDYLQEKDRNKYALFYKFALDILYHEGRFPNPDLCKIETVEEGHEKMEKLLRESEEFDDYPFNGEYKKIIEVFINMVKHEGTDKYIHLQESLNQFKDDILQAVGHIGYGYLYRLAINIVNLENKK